MCLGIHICQVDINFYRSNLANFKPFLILDLDERFAHLGIAIFASTLSEFPLFFLECDDFSLKKKNLSSLKGE